MNKLEKNKLALKNLFKKIDYYTFVGWMVLLTESEVEKLDDDDRTLFFLTKEFFSPGEHFKEATQEDLKKWIKLADKFLTDKKMYYYKQRQSNQVQTWCKNVVKNEWFSTLTFILDNIKIEPDPQSIPEWVIFQWDIFIKKIPEDIFKQFQKQIKSIQNKINSVNLNEFGIDCFNLYLEIKKVV